MKKIIAKVACFMLLCSAITLYAGPADNMANQGVEVGVTAVELAPANTARKSIRIFNEGTDTVYIDNSSSDCTVADSFPILSDTGITIENYQGPVFGIVATTTGTVKVMEIQY